MSSVDYHEEPTQLKMSKFWSRQDDSDASSSSTDDNDGSVDWDESDQEEVVDDDSCSGISGASNEEKKAQRIIDESLQDDERLRLDSEKDFVVPWLERRGPTPEEISNGQRQQISLALRPVPRDFHSLLPLLTDTHNHMAGYGEVSRWRFQNDKRKEIETGGIMHAKEYCVVSVEAEDWESCKDWRLTSVGKGGGGVGGCGLRQAIGIHPQCAEEYDPTGADGWLEKMRQCLRAAPSAIIGEIGIDKNVFFNSFYETHQREIFRKQLRVAVEFHRPVSVHCVKADGALLEILQEEISEGRELPPAICMHSFSGSLETAENIIKLVEGHRRNTNPPQSKRNKVFFGFSAWTNLHKKKIGRLILGLDETRLLLESDWNPYTFRFDESDVRDIDKILLWGVVKLAEISDQPPLAVARRLAENSKQFFSCLVQESIL